MCKVSWSWFQKSLNMPGMIPTFTSFYFLFPGMMIASGYLMGDSQGQTKLGDDNGLMSIYIPYYPIISNHGHQTWYIPIGSSYPTMVALSSPSSYPFVLAHQHPGRRWSAEGLSGRAGKASRLCRSQPGGSAHRRGEAKGLPKWWKGNYPDT